jgi:hypothetical protein
MEGGGDGRGCGQLTADCCKMLVQNLVKKFTFAFQYHDVKVKFIKPHKSSNKQYETKAKMCHVL